MIKRVTQDEVFGDLPGYYIRRLHQIAIGKFVTETGELGITPVQWAVLRAAKNQPEMDQRTMAKRVGFDTSTIGAVIDRLERRGLLERRISPHDKRVRLLVATAEAIALLKRMEPRVIAVQDWILAPLSDTDKKRFMTMMRTIVEAYGDSRGSLDTDLSP